VNAVVHRYHLNYALGEGMPAFLMRRDWSSAGAGGTL